MIVASYKIFMGPGVVVGTFFLLLSRGQKLRNSGLTI